MTGATLAISAADALAAPFAGTGHAAIGGDVDGLKARAQALERARKVALEAAIEQTGAADPAARKQVLQSASAWTGSYRVLQQGDDGATATAVVSVEIDTARLAKALAAPGAAAGGGYILPPLLPGLEVEAAGCPADAEAGLRRQLLAAGVVRDVAPGSAGPVLKASLQCEPVGVARYPRQTVVRVRAGWTGAAVPPAVVTGVGEDAAAAAGQALAEVGARAVRSLSPGTGAGLTLKLAAPWPAARVRRLERALRESVVGVQSVTLAGVGSDGSVRLRVEGALTAAELHARLAAVQVPGATLVALEIEPPHVVHASLQSTSP